ncbi:NlpC/P60 family protein [Buchananella felis]|uniref:C40 family peptidase n=1 Tax=Buchananella felis TaxID=3231492 RepID=UPI003528CE27
MLARRPRRVAASVIAAVLAIGGLATVAQSAPSDSDIEESRQKEATLAGSVASLELQLIDISARRDAAQLEVQIASEDYQFARDQLDAATRVAEEARNSASAAREQEQTARSRLAQVAANAYRNGGGSLTAFEPYLTEGGLTEIDLKAAAVDRLGTRAESEVQSYNALEQAATTLERRAVEAEEAQSLATAEVETRFQQAQAKSSDLTAQEAALDEEKTNVLNQLATQRGTTAELERQRDEENERIRREQAEAEARRQAEAEEAERQERERLEREERERQEREEAERRENEQNSGSDGGSGGSSDGGGSTWAPPPPAEPAPPPPPPPPVSNGNGWGAVQFARNAIGVPYVWGGDSMAGYDCSGLVQAAWGSQGYWLSHSSRMQYAETTRVPLSALEPGDLVFWSSNGTRSGVYHVAIYSGNGMIIHAPQPGAYVTEIPLYYSGGIMPYGGRVG